MANAHQKAFLQNMASLQLTKDYSDMSITCQGRTFKLHRLVVCPQSDVLNTRMKQQWNQPGKDIEDDVHSAETIDRMVQYLYSQDYDYKTAGAVTTPEPTAEVGEQIFASPDETSHVDARTTFAVSAVTADQATTTSPPYPVNEALLAHVEMHQVADYYNIPLLKALAVEKFEAVLEEHPWQQEGFIEVLEAVYSTQKRQDAGLRQAAQEIARANIRTLLDDERFREAVETSELLGALSYGLLGGMSRDLSAKQTEMEQLQKSMNAQIEELRCELSETQILRNAQAAARKVAEDELRGVISIFSRLSECKNVGCDRSIDVSVERGGKSGYGAYVVRCCKCKAKHS